MRLFSEGGAYYYTQACEKLYTWITRQFYAILLFRVCGSWTLTSRSYFTLIMSATKCRYIFQSVFLSESLQQEINNVFNIVTYKNLEEYKDKVVAICSVGSPTISGEFIESLPALKVIGCNSVGYDHVDVQTAAKLRIRVGYTPFVLDNATADTAMTLLLGSARRIVEGDKIARDPSTLVYPGNAFLGQEVSGSTIGIIGMGRIGTKIAKRAVGFDMKVLYHNRRQKSAEEECAVCATYVPVLNC